MVVAPCQKHLTWVNVARVGMNVKYFLQLVFDYFGGMGLGVGELASVVSHPKRIVRV
jgi:hypothetical protein